MTANDILCCYLQGQIRGKIKREGMNQVKGEESEERGRIRGRGNESRERGRIIRGINLERK